MAPSSGYHMVPKAVRAVKYAISRSSDYVWARLTGSGGGGLQKVSIEAIPVAVGAHTVRAAPRAIHPLALLRQSRSRHSSRQTRFFSTALASLSRLGARHVQPSSRFAASATRSALRNTTFAPFASPLRPNLTGGVLPRGAGGYGLGGGGINAARHFSHSSSAQAHVVQNVHAAVRAFVLQGQKPLYNGNDPRTGSARFRAVGPAEASAHKTIKQAPRGVSAWEARGTSLDFHIAPIVTAISAPGAGVEAEEANVLSEVLVKDLAGDFAHQLRDLAAVHADLKRLSQLGTLPISKPDASRIRVRFPGCDAAAVYALCDEVGVTRGVVREDPGWHDEHDEAGVETSMHDADRDVEMALLFPWAPSEPPSARGLYRGSTTGGSKLDAGERFFDLRPPAPSRHDMDHLEWYSMLSASQPSPDALRAPSIPHSFALLSSRTADSAPRGSPLFEFESLGTSEADSQDYNNPFEQVRTLTQNASTAPTGFEGVEGIYRFLREIEDAEARARTTGRY